MISQKDPPSPGVFVPKGLSLVSKPQCLFGFAPEHGGPGGPVAQSSRFGGCLKKTSMNQGKGTENWSREGRRSLTTSTLWLGTDLHENKPVYLARKSICLSEAWGNLKTDTAAGDTRLRRRSLCHDRVGGTSSPDKFRRNPEVGAFPFLAG